MNPVGYTFLNQHYNLLLPKLGLEVYQDMHSDVEKTVTYGASNRLVLPKSRKNLSTPYENMVAAIKYQGIRLHFFAAIFKVVDEKELTAFIADKPMAQLNRVIWYLYEWLTNKRLDLPALTSGNYVQLFDDRFYFTLTEGVRDKRTRVVNNAIGTKDFCPTVRKTPEIVKLAETDVYQTAYEEVQRLGKTISADVIGRSINYLYTKETRSSTEIENEKPDKKRMQRFLNAIKNAGLFELSKDKLIDIQNQIVAEKVRASDYRTIEIYVGTTIQKYGIVDEDVHYVGAKAEQLESMMSGLLRTHDNLMLDGKIPSLIHAAVISFAEVYIHPFDDGNGRIHRYLIHDVMKQREPAHKFIIPISAAILKNTERYDEVLESISKPIMAMLDWELDAENGNSIIINNDIDYMYRFPDYTEHVKFVYEMMNSAISNDLIEEICLLLVFDIIKKSMDQIEDIPNMKLDTLVSIIVSGGGTVSKRKRAMFLQYLDEEQLIDIEQKSIKIISETQEKFGINIQNLVIKTKTD
ncbi:Fic family protein [Paraglaciecola sp. L3A3]|uniref:Fic family protein n=1 Tax=Paraglaciecola sp. L3A3 TaxID=2686358 RepID=UPI00131B933D|nr:Fic family protein [Paraglaciecola sp. L3A3]